MTTPKAGATLAIFIISIVFVIHRVDLANPLSKVKNVPNRFQFLTGKIPISLTTAPIAAILILWATQCINPSVIRDGIVGTEGVKPYNILILFFSLAYMSITLDITGILRAAAHWVSNRGGNNGWKLFFYFYVMITLISVVVGNDPVILSGTAFLVYYTRAVHELKDKHLPWLISEFAAANTASMVLFVGNPTNVVICEGFGVQNAAFSAYTILPFLACSLVCFIALAVQYRADKHLPRTITATKLSPKDALKDGPSACFGGILLVTCLVVILVVSFFKPSIDVWVITLPFAGFKFIFDLARDYLTTRPRFDRKNSRKNSTPSEKTMSKSSTTTTVDPQSPVPQYSPQRPMPPSPTVRTADDPIIHPDHPVPQYQHPVPSPPTVRMVDDPITHPDPISEKIEHSSPEPSRTSTLVDQEDRVQGRFPMFRTALPRLPFALVPFAFSQFILIEALAHQGWIDVFAHWLVRATNRQVYPTIWVIGVVGVIMCNLSGTNIGATILLTKVVRAANMPSHTLRAAAIALAVASNIGAVSFTFAASLAGLLWKSIINEKGITCSQREFAKWNIAPLVAMTTVGLSVVSAEMAVLYGGKAS